MKKRLDTKSLLIGLIGGVLVTLALGAAAPGDQGSGRYQIDGTATHGLVIDTVTGQVWSEWLPEHRGKNEGEFYKRKR